MKWLLLFKLTLSMIFIMIFSLSCSDKNTEPKTESDYQLGKNYYTTNIDGDNREYYVHVPNSYDASSSIPVVFMLHGATGNGEGTYNNSGWKELGEEEYFLTVFPTAMIYCYTNSFGITMADTRWHSYPPITNFCTGQTLKDDVKFLRQIIVEVEQRFNVNSSMIYLVGFSSGAQMAFRCAVEMSDVFAAVVQSGATHQIDTIITPKRNLPIAFELGNMDETWFGVDEEMPMNLFNSSLTKYKIFKQIINVHTKNFNFDSSYTLTGDTTTALTATFKGIPYENNRVFTFTLINKLDHSYPNTVNHPRYGAKEHWEWLKQYSLP